MPGFGSNMSKHWTFLSHHAHVLLALSENPDHTIEELATIADLTPRSMVNILKDLEDGGYLKIDHRFSIG